MAVSTAARVWSPYKELYHTVTAAVVQKVPDAIQDLTVILRKNKPDFISLLRNPAKNQAHRNSVKKANVEGLPVQGRQTPQTLSEQFIHEVIIISDLFDLNEFAAVELLIAAENQQPYFPGLTRGLVAVLLYYDGRASLVSALKILIQSREGRTWTMGLPEDLCAMATKFTDQLLDEGLINRILELISEMDITKELDKLQSQRAIGHVRHRRQVLDKMTEIKQTLAECVFAWSCQIPLSRENTLRLIQHLKTADGLKANGSLDDVTLALLMALLYAMDVRLLEQEDADDIIQSLPIISDRSFVPDVHRELTATHEFKIPQLRAVAKLAWALTLRMLPQYYNQGGGDIYELDESLAESAIAEDAFAFLRQAVIGSEKFHQEKFYVTQIHNLVTDFIVQMPLKVKELRNSGDESARIIVANQQEGLEPPQNITRHFEHFMLMIGDLYGNDDLGLQLGLEFWCPQDPGQQVMNQSGFTSMYYHKAPQRQASLSKFVRLAGDLLPPPLFVPYLEMLTGLATGPHCAHYCYTLLKNNGAHSGGAANPISWDHFFMSMNQYYVNLRQENMPTSHDMTHVYRHHHQFRGITPQEVDGLACVLKLTQRIASQDEYARVALCENQQWLPLVVLVGLVGCSVPIVLKAEAFKTLAALAKTPDIATTLWQSIEVAQVLPTVGNTSLHAAQAAGGIQVELNEVEARNEDFPLTRAFLQLMDTLTDTPVPAALGAGYRAPGFQPYLDYLRDHIFLKFNTRAYKDPAEKWQVAAAVLGVLQKLLDAHEIVYEDFLDQKVELTGEGIVTLHKPAGHSLMLHMLNDTAMLKMVLYIIDEASKLLDKFMDLPGHVHLERAALCCLSMLKATLERQERFLSGLRETGAGTMVSQLDKLLMGINPRSGKADHLLNIAKYVTYNAHLPQHALTAVHILDWVCQSPLVQPKIVGLLTSQADVEAALLHGFVECIESDEPEELQPESDIIGADPSEAQVRSSCRQSILRLLLSTLDHPAPNLAHYLLGFELRKPVAKTSLQDPGVLNSPRTCLHAVLCLLDKGVDTRNGPTCLQMTPKLAELSYRLIYCMCANRDTSTPTLRYLRTTRDFLYRHLHHVPFTQINEKCDAGALLPQQSWLLKAVALELKLTSSNKQRSHAQRLMTLLLDDNPAVNQRAPDGVYEPEFSAYDDFSLYTSQTQNNTTTAQGIMTRQARRKILAVLDSIDFAQEFDGALDVDFFNASEIEQLIKSVEARNQDGVVQGNVRLLMRMLSNEVNQQGAASAQRQLQMAEVRSICARLVERNAYREAIHAKKEAFDSWRQVIEIVLTACPSDLLTGELRQNVLFEVLQELLVKVSKDDAVSELTGRVAGVILTLMANLRQCFMTDQPEGIELGHGAQYISLLDGTLPASSVPNPSAVFGSVSGARTLYASSLQVVLRGLIEYLMRTSSGSQRVRANLYGAMLYYLQIAQKPSMLPGEAGKGVGARVTSGDAEFEKLVVENMATISSYGDNFMQVVCRDACDGHDVGRMLSMATVDTIVTMDKHGHWLNFMRSKGYLQHIIGSLLQDDESLQNMLNPIPEPLRALYIFESKIGLLTRVAERAEGAHTLLQCGLMSRLAECTIFDLRPEGSETTDDSFVPSILNRYRKQILFPILKLCLAVLTSLGIENRQTASKVLQFVIAHIDVFSGILRERHPILTVDSLKELALVTGVIGRVALDDIEQDEVLGDTAAIEFKGHLMRLQRQLIALLPKFCLNEKTFKQIRNLEIAAGVDTQETRLQIQVSFIEIACNVVAFCRTLITKSGTGASNMYRILFGPNLDDALARSDNYSTEEYQTTLSTATYPQSLGLIVFMLRQATEHFLRTLDDKQTSSFKLDWVADLSAEDLKELCGADVSEKLSSQQRQALAKRKLLHLVAYKTQELQLFSYMIENCLLVIWRHLEYYLLRCQPDSGVSLYKTHAQKQSLRRLQDTSVTSPTSRSLRVDDDLELPSGITRQQLTTLKNEAAHCLNDSLFSKLSGIEECYSRQRNRYGFMEALVRRIKRLLTLHTTTS